LEKLKFFLLFNFFLSTFFGFLKVDLRNIAILFTSLLLVINLWSKRLDNYQDFEQTDIFLNMI